MGVQDHLQGRQSPGSNLVTNTSIGLGLDLALYEGTAVLPMEYASNEDHLRSPFGTTQVNVFRQMRTVLQIVSLLRLPLFRC